MTIAAETSHTADVFQTSMEKLVETTTAETYVTSTSSDITQTSADETFIEVTTGPYLDTTPFTNEHNTERTYAATTMDTTTIKSYDESSVLTTNSKTADMPPSTTLESVSQPHTDLQSTFNFVSSTDGVPTVLITHATFPESLPSVTAGNIDERTTGSPLPAHFKAPGVSVSWLRGHGPEQLLDEEEDTCTVTGCDSQPWIQVQFSEPRLVTGVFIKGKCCSFRMSVKFLDAKIVKHGHACSKNILQ